MRSAILAFHICGGLIGLLSGGAAMFLRKGSRQHGIAGDVFVISMLGMASAGVLLAATKSQPGNILGGMLTIYLVSTAWMTATRRERKTGMLDGSMVDRKLFASKMFDWGALLIVLTVATANVTFGIQAAFSPTGLRYDYPPGPYFFLGSIAIIALVGDIRMLVHNGISGTQRIARHLWRMCFALFVASSSLFLARQQLFPELMRKTGTLVLLSFLPLMVMIFWLIRVRFANALKPKGAGLTHA